MSQIAFLADNEEFWIFDLTPNPFKNRYLAGLLNNPVFVNTTTHASLEVGDIYDNGIFYKADDLEKNNPVQPAQGLSNAQGNSLIYISFISNNSIFGIVQFDPDNAINNLVIPGIQSNAICIDVTANPEVEVGWTWDGQFFNPPMNG